MPGYLHLAPLFVAAAICGICLHSTSCPGLRWGEGEHEHLTSMLLMLVDHFVVLPAKEGDALFAMIHASVKRADDLGLNRCWINLVSSLRTMEKTSEYADQMINRSRWLAERGRRCHLKWLPHAGMPVMAKGGCA